MDLKFSKISTDSIIDKKFYLCFIPIILDMVVEGITFLVCNSMIGRMISPEALSVVNIMEPFASFFEAVAIVFGIGSSSILIRTMNKNKATQINIISTCFIAIIVVTVLIWAILFPTINFFASSFTDDPVFHKQIKQYFIPFIINAPIMMFGILLYSLLRAEGKFEKVTKLYIIGDIIYIAIVFVVLRFLHLGLTWVAIALSLIWILGILLSVKEINVNKRFILKFKFPDKTGFIKIFNEIFVSGFPYASNLLLKVLCLEFMAFLFAEVGGIHGLICFSMYCAVDCIMYIFINSVSETAIFTQSFSYAEKDYQGSRRILRHSFFVMGICVGLTLIVSLVFPTFFSFLFGIDKIEDLKLIKSMLKVYSIALPMEGYIQLIICHLSSILHKKISSIVTLVHGLLIIPVCWIFSSLYGIHGIFYSLIITDIITILVMRILIYRIRVKSKDKLDPYLIPRMDESEITSYVVNTNAANSSSAASEFLQRRISVYPEYKDKSVRIALAVEEIINIMLQNNNKNIQIELKVNAAPSFLIVSLCDTGLFYDITSEENYQNEEGSPITVLRNISKKITHKSIIGINHTVIYV